MPSHRSQDRGYFSDYASGRASEVPLTIRIAATIEARMAATRLPGKVMFPLAGVPMLQRLVERVRRAKLIDEVIVASTIQPPDEVIADLCERIDCRVYRGSLEDITQRLLNAAEEC